MRVKIGPLWTSSACLRRAAHVATTHRDLSHDSLEAREPRVGSPMYLLCRGAMGRPENSLS